MKFLVITDLHQKTENIPWINGLVDEYGPEAILCLGDVTDMGTGDQAGARRFYAAHDRLRQRHPRHFQHLHERICQRA